MKISVLYIVCLFAIICCKSNGIINIGQRTEFNIQRIDTIAVDISTVYVDSQAVTQPDRLLVGGYSHPAGYLRSTSYFKIEPTNFQSDGRLFYYENSFQYDSLVLVLPNNGYWYGDTTKPFNLSVHYLKVPFYPKTGDKFYTTTTLGFNEDKLASARYLFESGNRQDFRLRMSDSLGQYLFDLNANEDYRISSILDFQNLFNGLAIVPNTQNQCVLGFSLPNLYIYYHDRNNPENLLTYQFKCPNASSCFNSVRTSKLNKGFNSLKYNYETLESKDSDQFACLSTNGEYLIQFKIPTLDGLKERFKNMIISKAYIKIKPKVSTYGNHFYLPSNLRLFESDNNERFIPINYDYTATIQQINPTVDLEFADKTFYEFEITEFVERELKEKSYSKKSLVLAAGGNTNERCEYLVVGAAKNDFKIELIVYITSSL